MAGLSGGPEGVPWVPEEEEEGQQEGLEQPTGQEEGP